MKLFLYDSKHDRINNEFDLCKLKDNELDTVKMLLKVIRNMGLTDDHRKELVLAKSWKYTKECIEEEGDEDYVVVFEGRINIFE